MGPAILNGGITTFLALFFLAFSQSYAFIVFFKVSSSFLFGVNMVHGLLLTASLVLLARVLV